MPELTKEQLYIILGAIAVVLIGCVVGVFNAYSVSKQSSPETSPTQIIADNKPKIKSTACFVHISGAVIREGVYKLNAGDRIIDLLKLAGAASNADLDSINLAEPLSDGEKVDIPRNSGNSDLNGKTRSFSISPDKSGKTDKIVNINTADEKELDSLPGIGPVMAKKIADYRSEKGTFYNIEELKGVPGISEKKFDKLKNLISVY
jgi:competence protein ComEA